MATYILLAFLGFSAGFITMTLVCGASKQQLNFSIILGLLSLLVLLHLS